MLRKPLQSTVVSILGLIVVLGIAWCSDAVRQYYNIKNFDVRTVIFANFWGYPLIVLLFAALMLILAWFVLIQAPKNAWICLVFLVIGLLIVFYPALYYVPAIGLPSIDVLLNPTSNLFSSGGFIAIIGLIALIFRSGKRTGSK
jgi:hypothetical protein